MCFFLFSFLFFYVLHSNEETFQGKKKKAKSGDSDVIPKMAGKGNARMRAVYQVNRRIIPMGTNQTTVLDTCFSRKKRYIT